LSERWHAVCRRVNSGQDPDAVLEVDLVTTGPTVQPLVQSIDRAAFGELLVHPLHDPGDVIGEHQRAHPSSDL
jgi:hypothetical protein